MKDNRQLFAHLCSRKESQWEDMGHVRNLDDTRMGILMSLPQKIVPWQSSPMDDIFYKPKLQTSSRHTDENGWLEWVVQRMGSGDEELEHYYVNTEGYPYARYGFKFEPRQVT